MGMHRVPFTENYDGSRTFRIPNSAFPIRDVPRSAFAIPNSESGAVARCSSFSVVKGVSFFGMGIVKSRVVPQPGDDSMLKVPPTP